MSTSDELPPEIGSLLEEAVAGFERDVAPYRDDRVIEVAAASESESDVRDALVAYWEALGQVTDALAEDAWDVLVCDVRGADEGLVMGWAAKLRRPFVLPERPDDEEVPHVIAVPGALVQATIPGADPCDAVDLDPDDPDYDEAVEPLLLRDLETRAGWLRSAADDARLEERMRRWRARPGFGAFWASCPGIPYEAKFTRLFGEPLPLPEQPTSALGVFARLFQAHENAVYRSNSCFTFEGDELVEVRLEGHGITDEVIDLLDWVQDLDGVCQGLRRITLEETRVSKEGRAKLERLFPKRGIFGRRVVVR